jgi:hypothetical protein
MARYESMLLLVDLQQLRSSPNESKRMGRTLRGRRWKELASPLSSPYPVQLPASLISVPIPISRFQHHDPICTAWLTAASPLTMPFEAPQTHSISDLSFPRDIYASVLTKQGAEALKDMPTPINFKRLSKAVKEARARKAKEEEGAETRKGKGKERASGKDDSKRKRGSSPSLGQEEEDPYKKIKLEQQNDDEDDDLTPLSSPNPSLAAASSAVPARPLPSSPFPLFAHSFTYNPQRPQPPAPAPQGWGYRATAADSERKKAILATYKDRKAFLDLLFADVDPNEDEEEEEGDEEGAEVLDLGEVWLCPSQDGKGGPLVLAEEIRGLSSIETKKFVGQETLFQCEEMSNGMVGDWVDGSDFKGRWVSLHSCCARIHAVPHHI